MISRSDTVDKIIDELSKELKDKVEELVDLVESKEALEIELEEKQRDVRRLKLALEALTGASIPVSQGLVLGSEPVSEPSVSQEPPARQPSKPAVQPPRQKLNPCNSCGGEMYFQSRTLQSGKVVNLWQCSECSNERF